MNNVSVKTAMNKISEEIWVVIKSNQFSFSDKDIMRGIEAHINSLLDRATKGGHVAICDETNNTEDDLKRGIVNVTIRSSAEIDDIKTSVKKIREGIIALQKQLEEIQDKCTHKNVSKIARADTGNYSKSDDSYWYECECPSCGKKWLEDR